MNKQEAQEVVNETVSSVARSFILALIIIGLLPVLSFTALSGSAAVVAYPGATIVWIVIIGLGFAVNRSAKNDKRRAHEVKRLEQLRLEKQRQAEWKARNEIQQKLNAERVNQQAASDRRWALEDRHWAR